MENKGAKVALVIFMILAIAAFSFGTVLAVPLLTAGDAQTAQEATGQIIAFVILTAPFLIAYIMFALFDIISLFLAIHLIKNDSKGMGIFNLILICGMLAAAIYISVSLLG